MKPLRRWWCSLTLAAGLASAAEVDWAIRPGRSLGKVELGMTHAQVLQLLGTPHHQEDLGFISMDARDATVLPQYVGVLREDWIAPRPAAVMKSRRSEDGWPVMADYVTVYFRQGQVCQIEANSPKFHTPEGLCLKDKAAAFAKRHPKAVESPGGNAHPSAGGIPAGKRFTAYEDAMEEGFSWRAGWYGNGAPDFDPETESPDLLIVHAKGVPVLIDPDHGGRFAWKDYPWPSKE